MNWLRRLLDWLQRREAARIRKLYSDEDERWLIATREAWR